MENSAHTMEEMQAVPLLCMVGGINTSYFVIVEVGEKNIRALVSCVLETRHCLVLETLQKAFRQCCPVS